MMRGWSPTHHYQQARTQTADTSLAIRNREPLVCGPAQMPTITQLQMWTGVMLMSTAKGLENGFAEPFAEDLMTGPTAKMQPRASGTAHAPVGCTATHTEVPISRLTVTGMT